jgi:hypothetical protein
VSIYNIYINYNILGLECTTYEQHFLLFSPSQTNNFFKSHDHLERSYPAFLQASCPFLSLDFCLYAPILDTKFAESADQDILARFEGSFIISRRVSKISDEWYLGVRSDLKRLQ